MQAEDNVATDVLELKFVVIRYGHHQVVARAERIVIPGLFVSDFQDQVLAVVKATLQAKQSYGFFF